MKLKKLEAIRGFTALYVFASHLIGVTVLNDVMPYYVKLVFNFGQAAVILFFLLSGFVIYLSESRSTIIDFPKYLLKRFVRIYPILIASFIIGVIVAVINGHHFVWKDARDLIGNIFMLQDMPYRLGNIVNPFLNNIPLWTLSYECGFYLMFYPVYIFFFKNSTTRILPVYVVLFISMASWLLYMLFPNHLFLVGAYFTLWWTGVACAQIYAENKTFTYNLLKPVLIALAVMMMFAALPLIFMAINGQQILLDEYPFANFRHYGVALFTILAGLAWWKLKLKGFDSIFGFFEKLAPISYALYIIHFSLIKLEIPNTNIYLSLSIGVVLTFLFSYLLEIKMQPVFNRLLLGRQTK